MLVCSAPPEAAKDKKVKTRRFVRLKTVYDRETMNLKKGSFPTPALAKNQAEAAERIETQNYLLGMLIIHAEKEAKWLKRETTNK